MAEPQVISLSEAVHLQPNLSVSSSSDVGTIKLNNLPPLDTPKKSVNFGPGADLLMNHNRTSRANSPKSDISISELKSLDINSATTSRKSAENLMMGSRPPATTSVDQPSSGIRLVVNDRNTAHPSVQNTSLPTTDKTQPTLGTATAQDPKKNETWDGFKKFNEIPVNPTTEVPDKPKMAPAEILKQKLIFLRKLEALEKKGITLTKKYTMEAPLAEMQGEYEMIKSEKEKSNSVKFQGKMMMAFVSAVEFLNGKFDPFDINIDGWGESVSENLDDYDEIFGELHEKYGGKTKMAPEIKLLFMLGGSAGMLHMTNTMFKSSMPGMDDIMRQNPELMQQFTQAAVSSMSQQNPGFGGFMQSAMQRGPPNMPPNMGTNMPPNMRAPRGSPPGPSEHMRRRPPPMPTNMSGRRPDIGMARGHPTFRDAENMEESFGSVREGNRKIQKSARPEMKGPADINDLLSGLKKTKHVNIQKSGDTQSTISVTELKEMNNADLSNPKKSKRRPRSERNNITLNI